MQAAAVALTVLSAVFSLDCLSAHRSKPNQIHHQSDGNARHEETPPKQKKQPHIIFILTDDQGFNDIGYHNPTIKTPTLDKLAAEGVKLENYYVQPICTPSRSQLLTGRYQIHTGLQHSIIRPRQPSCLPSHMDTLPERLREAGYTTHMVGKWHLGFYRKACLPTRKGFDSFFGSLTGSVDYYSYGSCDGPGLCGYDLHDDEGVAWGQEGKYSTVLFTQRARKILESYDPTDKPLFLLFSLQAVHTPLQTPKSYIYPYRDMANVARRKFAAMVSTVDEAVRNVTYALRKYGYYRNSVIIYSTDNGAQPFTGGSNWPLRGRKGTYWEGGMRGVAFVHSPLLKRRRRVSKALLHITDWFPTLVGLAGGNISQSQGLDGFDVWPTISEGKDSPRQEILHNIDPLHKSPGASTTARYGQIIPPQPVWDTSVQAAIRVGDWKLLTGDPGHGDWVPPQVLPTLPGRWWNLERGFSIFYKSPIHKNVWLFNITGDPYERQDLADQRPDVVQRLLARLVYYNQTAVPVYFPPDDPRANPSQHGGAWVPWVDEEEDNEGKYDGVYKKNKNKKKRKKKKCQLCKLKSFFLKLNTRMMSNRI
ncbi:arylsulfatase I-like isoform X1 [Scomber japonicus]|uniref:arylsulfatase I-like isoform X1 n=1 Tax=Scomber japonicus TaxID=13676 RepID=UPI00230506D5|nr:arylsulfatase I-like isoform X1 [Scomber japonicus]